MSEELDKVLNRHDRIDRVHKYFKSIGSTDEQAATAAAAHADKFVYDGAVLSFQGKPVADADSGVREFFEANNLGFLLPPKTANADAPQVDPAVLASARAGNITAKGRLVRQLGSLAAADAVLADKNTIGADDKAKDKPVKLKGTNPWAPGSWSVTAQGKLVRELGLAAATSIAASAGSFIGATKPARTEN